MEATGFSETSADFQWTTRRYTAEESSVKQVSICYLLHAGFLLGLAFKSEDDSS
jgi:hypothetical protein